MQNEEQAILLIHNLEPSKLTEVQNIARLLVLSTNRDILEGWVRKAEKGGKKAAAGAIRRNLEILAMLAIAEPSNND